MDPRLKDFKNFLYLTWNHLNLPEPTPIQYDIADFLQHGPKRLVIEAFRGVGKSWITSAFVCHQLLLDPQKKVGYRISKDTSGGYGTANNFGDTLVPTILKYLINTFINLL